MRHFTPEPDEREEDEGPGPLREFVFDALIPATVRVRARSLGAAWAALAARDNDIPVDYLAHDGTRDGEAVWITFADLATAEATFREEGPDGEIRIRLAQVPESELLPVGGGGVRR